MQLTVQLSEGAYLPKTGYANDLGIDLCTKDGVHISPFSSATINTGVRVQVPEVPSPLKEWFNMGCFIKSKSGLSVKSNIEKGAGVIDPGYTGELVIKLYNHGPQSVQFEPGDKIAQMVFQPCLKITSIVEGDVTGGERGERGFGSTGV